MPAMTRAVLSKSTLSGGVFERVVMLVAHGGGVGGHERRPAVAPELRVIRRSHAAQEFGRAHALRWEFRVAPEEARYLSDELLGGRVAHKGDEVADGRVEEIQRRRADLAFGAVVVVADGLQIEHPDDVVARVGAGRRRRRRCP
jgi:hypothetical protein